MEHRRRVFVSFHGDEDPAFDWKLMIAETAQRRKKDLRFIARRRKPSSNWSRLLATSIACVCTYVRGDRFTREIGAFETALTKPVSLDGLLVENFEAFRSIDPEFVGQLLFVKTLSSKNRRSS